MAGNSTESGRSVTSKVTAILMTFTAGNAHSLTEIARLAGLPISTTHRLATELASWRVLERTEDGSYRAGLPLRMLGAQPWQAPSLLDRAPHVMADLSTATRTSVRLGVLHNLDVAYIEKPVGQRPVSAFSSGAMLPSHATAVGKALLAFAPQRITEMVVARGLRAYTEHTLTAPDRLRRALAVTRLTRVAVSRWELETGVSAVAMPVFGTGGNVLAALELRVRDVGDDFQGMKAALTVAARSLSRELAAGNRDRRAVGAS